MWSSGFNLPLISEPRTLDSCTAPPRRGKDTKCSQGQLPSEAGAKQMLPWPRQNSGKFTQKRSHADSRAAKAHSAGWSGVPPSSSSKGGPAVLRCAGESEARWAFRLPAAASLPHHLQSTRPNWSPSSSHLVQLRIQARPLNSFRYDVPQSFGIFASRSSPAVQSTWTAMVFHARSNVYQAYINSTHLYVI